MESNPKLNKKFFQELNALLDEAEAYLVQWHKNLDALLAEEAIKPINDAYIEAHKIMDRIDKKYGIDTNAPLKETIQNCCGLEEESLDD